MPEQGNGAREKLIEYLDTQNLVNFDTVFEAADHFLTWMWTEGFKIVPIDAALRAKRKGVSK